MTKDELRQRVAAMTDEEKKTASLELIQNITRSVHALFDVLDLPLAVRMSVATSILVHSVEGMAKLNFEAAIQNVTKASGIFQKMADTKSAPEMTALMAFLSDAPDKLKES